MDDGYIKFNCKRVRDKPIQIQRLIEINNLRDKLYGLKLVGASSDGVGFGNISMKLENNEFIITGLATGNFSKLDGNHYALVNDYDFSKNSLTCKGPINVSSESLSHAMIYECLLDTKAVIHIHNLEMWEKLKDKMPTTREDVSYGTPEMAEEIKRLFRESNVSDKKIIVMGGRREGIIFFGRTLDEAEEVLLKYFND
ncbi:MAG: class II aldolase/adducin family protein [Nanoarchaeota archaeon]|nr:class II aldolase/adducin family protein [Nanoarchaeota archaeon]